MKEISILCFLLEISLVLSAPSSSIDDVDVFNVLPTDVTFRLYTPASPTTYISLQKGQLSGVSLDSSLPFKFIIHGWTDNAGKQWVADMKDAYLKKGQYNVVAVDWSRVALQVYNVAAADTKEVGAYVAELITDLHDTLGVEYTNVHLVGHSLGSHVSGFCGQHLLATVNSTIARITGMDPAGPLFVGESPDSRLSPGDATFVDIIHTAGGTFGYYDTCGDVDFYPNGGIPLQPGCLTRATADGKDIEIPCSHVRAYMYHTESIISSGFVSRECDSYLGYYFGYCKNNAAAVMGENVDKSTTGVFYLTTNLWSPYARFDKI